MTVKSWLGIAAIAIGAVAVAAGCATAPLFAYAASLATFGLAHVLTELRYVDRRFSRRFGPGALRTLLALLGAIVALRLAAFVPGASALPLRELELAAVAGLAAAAAAPCLRRGEPVAAALSVAVTAAIASGLAVAPGTTLVVFALLHNLTPIGFLAERLEGAPRRRALALCAFAFVVVPAVIVSGVFTEWLVGAAASSPDFAPFPVGPIEAHLGVFVPQAWLDERWAIDLFAAAAYLQCAHYAVVIGVLPRLGAEEPGAPLLPWPRGARFVLLTCVAAGLALAGFVQAFGDSRRAYGVVAAIHAWSEVPVLLLSVGAGFRIARAASRRAPSIA
jgi:hypothetical protein